MYTIKIRIVQSTLTRACYFVRANMIRNPDGPKAKPIGKGERSLWHAAIAALLVHAMVLGALEHWGALPEPQNEVYAAVDFVDYESVETQTMEEAVRERLEAKLNQDIRNVAADAQADRTDEVQSSRATDSRMSEDVEAELRAFEQAAFDALSEGRTGDLLPSSDVNTPAKETPLNAYENWDARYSGQVTAEFDLGSRKALNLDIPGYRCRSGGVVVLTIFVSPGGDVEEVLVVSAQSDSGAALTECLESESLKSAQQCRFQSQANAPRRQKGTLTYRFIAQ